MIEKTMKPLVRPLITSAIFLGGIFALTLAPALDRRGMPGGLFAAAILLLLMLLSVRVILGEFPPRGRRRMLAEAARIQGLQLRIRPRIPRSMKSLPSFTDGRTFGADAWNLIAFPGEPVVLTFDRRVTWQDSYESPMWMASAACRIRFEAPRLIVEPRPTVATDPLGSLPIRSSESDRFGHRYRIRTEDPLFQTAFLDQRMLAWILDQRDGLTYEVGGEWAMVSHRDLADPTRLEESVELLRRFRGKIPSVASSMRSTQGAR
jgi:hypothetical protein